MVCRMVLLAAICCIMPNPVTVISSSETVRDRERPRTTSPPPNSRGADRDSLSQADHGAAQRQADGAGQRAHARHRHQESQRVRSAVQDVDRDHRHQHRVGHPDDADQARATAESSGWPATPPRISILPPAPAGRFSAAARGCAGRDLHRQQRPDHGDVADPVDQKTNAGSGGRDEHSRDGRTHQLALRSPWRSSGRWHFPGRRALRSSRSRTPAGRACRRR